jgi:hypothetical protein
LNYRRPPYVFANRLVTTCFYCLLVEGEGFEPSKAEPSDLQSDPFDRSGTPPAEPVIIAKFGRTVNRYVTHDANPAPTGKVEYVQYWRNW